MPKNSESWRRRQRTVGSVEERRRRSESIGEQRGVAEKAEDVGEERANRPKVSVHQKVLLFVRARLSSYTCLCALVKRLSL